METQVLIVIALLAGAALVAVVAWILLKARARYAGAAELATLTESLAGKENELHRLQEVADREFEEHRNSREENAGLRAALEGERRAAQERKESFKQAAEEL